MVVDTLLLITPMVVTIMRILAIRDQIRLMVVTITKILVIQDRIRLMVATITKILATVDRIRLMAVTIMMEAAGAENNIIPFNILNYFVDLSLHHETCNVS